MVWQLLVLKCSRIYGGRLTSPNFSWWDILSFFDFLSFFPIFFVKTAKTNVTSESNVWVSRCACSIFAINFTTQKAWYLSSLAVFVALVVVFVRVFELPVFVFFFFFFADSVCDTSGLYHIQLKNYLCSRFFPLVFLYMHLIFLFILFILFSNFYVQSYLKKNMASRSNREKKVD